MACLSFSFSINVEKSLRPILVCWAWIPTTPCVVKRLLFRVKHCRTGNTDPCIEL
jgi:hypothetical protein